MHELSVATPRDDDSEAFKDCSSLEQGFLHVDEYRINQVIRNLIDNAIKFTPPTGSVTISFDLVNTDLALNAKSYTTDVIGALQIQVRHNAV